MKTKIEKQLILAGAALLLNATAFAQNAPSGIEFVESLSVSSTAKTPLKSGGTNLGDVSSTDLTEALSMSMPVTESISLNVGASYHGVFFDFDDNATQNISKRLQSLGMSAGVDWCLSDKWTLTSALSSTWNNSGKGFSSDGYGLSCFAGAIHPLGENTTLMFGLGYDSLAKDAHKVLPGFGIQWTASPTITVSLGFPMTGIKYQVNERFSVSLQAEGEISTYYMRGKDLSAAASALNLGNSKMEYQDLRMGLNCAYDLNAHFSLSASAGYMFVRKFDFFERDYKIESDRGSMYGSLGITAKF